MCVYMTMLGILHKYFQNIALMSCLPGSDDWRMMVCVPACSVRRVPGTWQQWAPHHHEPDARVHTRQPAARDGHVQQVQACAQQELQRRQRSPVENAHLQTERPVSCVLLTLMHILFHFRVIIDENWSCINFVHTVCCTSGFALSSAVDNHSIVILLHEHYRYIHSKNRAGLGFSLAVNHLADLSHFEIKRLRGYTNSRQPNNAQPFTRQDRRLDVVPYSVDWRLYGKQYFALLYCVLRIFTFVSVIVRLYNDVLYDLFCWFCSRCRDAS